MHQSDRMKEALVLSAAQPDHSIELARCLAELKANKLLPEFIAASGSSRRKSYYLAQIGRELEKLSGIPDDRLTAIGWTKLQIVLRHIDDRDALDLVELAEKHKAHELKRMLPKDPLVGHSRCVVLYFSPDQYADFEKAIVANGGKRSRRGLSHKEKALIAMIGRLNSIHSK
ncbi:hypothetical protein NKJ81_29000 [Mesorhizobium sp. M0018]|uniref:hypothetical protein n=1 Tax=Mesorhizobium sp. M0018 TaxID=2956844 RepID=UPI00333C7747